MVRTHARFGLALGVSLALAAACSSSDDKKTPQQAGADAGAAGDAEGGSGASTPGGAPTEGGMAAGGASGTGGEGVSDPTDGWRSGTRLRAVLQVAGDTKLFKVWHDTELDIDCVFAFDAEGTERCVPENTNGYPAYSDAKCTKPIGIFDKSREVPSLLLDPSTKFTCHHGPRYREVGAEVAVTQLYIDSAGACVANSTVTETQIVKALGAFVPESSFVATAQTLQEPRDARLSANVRYAEDGSRQVFSHFDLEREADCNPRLHAGDGYACLPEDRAYIEYFYADDACLVPAAYHPGYAHQTCGRAPKIIQDSQAYYSDGYYEVGEQVTDTVYRKDTDCVAYVSPGDPEATYFAIGKKVPWSKFAPLSSANEGTGRVLVQVLRGADDELVSRENFYDTVLGTVCRQGTASDLKERCLPEAPFQPNGYADDQCTEGLYATDAGGEPPLRSDFLRENAPGCGSFIFRLGAKVATPSKLWNLNGADCGEAPVNVAFDYYATTIVEPDEMQPIALETE